MQKLKKSLKILAVLFVLALFWLFYFILQITYGSAVNENHNYIPENAQLIVVFNGDLAIKSVLSDFFSAQDETLLEKVNTEKEDVKTSTGINLLSDVVLFSIDEQNKKITGLIFNLTNEKHFKSNFDDNIIASNKSVGVLLFDSNTSFPKKKLKSIAQSLITKKTDLYTLKLSKSRVFSSYISIWSRKKIEKSDWKYAQFSINENEINLAGEFVTDEFQEVSTNQFLANSNSFNISVSQLPKQFSDTILSVIQVDSNQIVGISTNYRSLRIEQENSFEIIPDADFIYQFDRDVNAFDILNRLEKKKSILELTAVDFTFGEKQFNYKQIDSKTIYIGRSDFKQISFKNSNSILEINGSPSYLTEIEGNSFILRLISIFPAYRVGNSLSNAIKNIDLKVNSISNSSIKIDGKIEFKKGKFASIELIRNLLELPQ